MFHSSLIFRLSLSPIMYMVSVISLNVASVLCVDKFSTAMLLSEPPCSRSYGANENFFSLSSLQFPLTRSPMQRAVSPRYGVVSAPAHSTFYSLVYVPK